MKTKYLSVISALTLSIASSVYAQTQIVGHGSSYSSLPPDCDAAAYKRAKLEADQDAAQQCQGEAERTSDYETGCGILAHGYAARASASATYDCQPQS